MESGTVKFYNDQKGYGFIAPDNGSKDVFVHATALERAGIRGPADQPERPCHVARRIGGGGHLDGGGTVAADGAGHSLIPLPIADPTNEELDYGGNWRASTYRGAQALDPEFIAEIERQFGVLEIDLERQRAAIHLALKDDWLAAAETLSGYEERWLEDIRRRRAFAQSMLEFQQMRSAASQVHVAQIALLDCEFKAFDR